MTRAAALFGVILFLGLLEIGMRVLGLGALAEQGRNNKIFPKDAQRLRIVTIGESTTADDFFSVPTLTSWPRQLELKLRQSGVDVRVYNLGRPAITSNGIIENLPAQLDLYRPDIAISMMVANDPSSLIGPDWSWWSSFRVVKLVRYLLDRRTEAPRFGPKNYCSPMASAEILRAFRESDWARAFALLEKNLELLDDVQKAENYYYWTLTIEKGGDVPKERLVELRRRALAASFQAGPILNKLVKLLAELGRDNECLELAKTYLTKNWRASDSVIFHFTMCADRSGQDQKTSLSEWAEILAALKGPGHAPDPVKGDAMTGRNYKAVARMLAERKIKHIAMQYPTRDLQELISHLKTFGNFDLAPEFSGITFIENKKNFKEALTRYRYEDIFIDRFANSWGHTTNLGSSMIAETAMDAILALKRPHP